MSCRKIVSLFIKVGEWNTLEMNRNPLSYIMVNSKAVVLVVFSNQPKLNIENKIFTR